MEEWDDIDDKDLINFISFLEEETSAAHVDLERDDNILTEEEANSFIKGNLQKKNTVQSTKRDVNNIQRWMAINLFNVQNIENLDPAELNSVLKRYFISVRKQDGTNYEPSSLTAMLYSVDRHLKENDVQYSVLKDREFTGAREALKAKRVDLKKQGMGRKPNKAKPLTWEEEEELYNKGVFGNSTPFTLIFSLWYYLTMCMGLRGRDEQRKLCWGDIQLKRDAITNKEYLVMYERDSKTRDGGEVDEARATCGKYFCCCEEKGDAKCAIEWYKEYGIRRPANSKSPTDPFFLTLIPESRLVKKEKENENVKLPWFYNGAMGPNTLGNLLPKACEMAGIERKTNHAVRHTCVRRLRKDQIPDDKIAQITGHKDLRSLASYDHLSDDEHEEIQAVLQGKAKGKTASATQSVSMTSTSVLSVSNSSNTTEATPIQPHTAENSTQQADPLALGQIFHGAVINNCHISINVNTVPAAPTHGAMHLPLESNITLDYRMDL